MKKSIFAAVMMLFGFCVGCGPTATDTSNTPPPPTEEAIEQEIQQAMDSEEIDPESYGQSE